MCFSLGRPNDGVVAEEVSLMTYGVLESTALSLGPRVDKLFGKESA